MTFSKCFVAAVALIAVLSVLNVVAEQLNQTKCVSSSAPNVFAGVHLERKGAVCGSRLADGEIGRCPFGECCSARNECGPRKGPDGQFHAGGFLIGPIISEEMATALFCDINQGDWRYVPCEEDAVQVLPEQTLADLVASSDHFTTLLAAAEAAGLVSSLSEDRHLTIFAPTDEAFESLPDGTLEELLDPENLEDLQNLVRYHVVEGVVSAADILKTPSLRTLSGDVIRVSVGENDVLLNGETKIVEKEHFASNGVLHTIDAVLSPLHDVKDDNTFSVVAREAGIFNYILAAAELSGVNELLQGPEPITLFAPVDNAFRNVSQSEVERLLSPEAQDELIDLLSRHAVAGNLTASSLVVGESLTSINEYELPITQSDDEHLTVGGAHISVEDLLSNNGVLHGIESVIGWDDHDHE